MSSKLVRGWLSAAFVYASGCGSSTPQQKVAIEPETPPQAITIGSCAPPSQLEEIQLTDVNKDGQPEVCKYYSQSEDPQKPGQTKKILLRQALDINWDGRIDIKRFFAADGLVTREEWDADYDGKVDEVRIFKQGKIARSDRDLDNDGLMEVVRYYTDGKLERKETDTNKDGQVDRWEYFNGMVIDRIGIDRDFDGNIDSWSRPNAASEAGTS